MLRFEALAYGGTVVTLARDTLTFQEWDGDVPDRLVRIPQDAYVGPSDLWNPFTTHRPDRIRLRMVRRRCMGRCIWRRGSARNISCLSVRTVGRLTGSRMWAITRLSGMGGAEQDRILSLYERDHRRMKDWLVANYGVTVYSLNPFINLNLEGHTFTGPDGRY
jgi:hypothetical protein